MTVAPGQVIPKPVPKYGADTAPYWEHVKEHSLHLQKCASCGKLRMYPRPMCDNCYSLESEWVPAKGTGKVYSWCTVFQPVHPAWKDELPFTIVEVELDEGVRIRSTVVDVPHDQLQVGMPVEAIYDDVSDEVTVVKFRRV